MRNTPYHIVYCWELGSGYGHLHHINWVVRHLAGDGVRFSFVLKDLSKAQSIEHCHNGNLFQAPIALPTGKRGPATNFSEVLLQCGWEKEPSAIGLVAGWRNLFSHLQADLVLTDHSPAAGFAAISLGIPLRSIGNGFSLPPLGTQMPSIQPWAEVPVSHLTAVDNHLTVVLNRVNQYFSLPEMQRMTMEKLLNPQHCLIMGASLMDHYGQRGPEWRYLQNALCSSGAGAITVTPNHGENERLFFYLDANTPRLNEWFSSLSQRYRLFGHIRNCTADIHARLSRMGVQVHARMLDIDTALAHADAVLCHASVGTVHNALRAGTPLISIPQYIEQAMIAYRLTELNLGCQVNQTDPPEKVLSAVNQVLSNKAGYRAQMRRLLPGIDENEVDYSALLRKFVGLPG